MLMLIPALMLSIRTVGYPPNTFLCKLDSFVFPVVHAVFPHVHAVFIQVHAVFPMDATRCLISISSWSVLKLKQHFVCPQIWSPRPAGFFRVQCLVVGTRSSDQIRREAAMEYLASSSEP